MQPSDVGIGPPVRHRLVPSLQWAVAPFQGCGAPWAWIFGGELTTWVPVLPSFTWSIFFFRDMFTLCQSHYGVYACTHGRATIPDSDGMDPNTQVDVVWCMWASEDVLSVVLIR
jgi:hypothetical protein